MAGLLFDDEDKGAEIGGSKRARVAADRLPPLSCVFIKAGPATQYGQTGIVVVSTGNGGDKAEDGPLTETWSSDSGPDALKTKLYQWVGEGRRSLQVNAWRQGYGKGMPGRMILLNPPIVLDPGYRFTAGIGKDSKLPTKSYVPCMVTNLLPAFRYGQRS